MEAVELMETLAKAVVENPKLDVSFMIMKKTQNLMFHFLVDR